MPKEQGRAPGTPGAPKKSTYSRSRIRHGMEDISTSLATLSGPDLVIDTIWTSLASIMDKEAHCDNI